jgi:hypothetical protein
MNTKRKASGRNLSEEEIDKIVVDQAEDETAWEKPVRVKRAKPAFLSIPAELVASDARASFVSQLHREKDFKAWLTRIIRERIELEEVAFAEAKRELSSRDNT